MWTVEDRSVGREVGCLAHEGSQEQRSWTALGSLITPIANLNFHMRDSHG